MRSFVLPLLITIISTVVLVACDGSRGSGAGSAEHNHKVSTTGITAG